MTKKNKLFEICNSMQLLRIDLRSHLAGIEEFKYEDANLVVVTSGNLILKGFSYAYIYSYLRIGRIFSRREPSTNSDDKISIKENISSKKERSGK